MIDEELYQLAADELNSDRRKASIWARACALASDDHDEARYLYTNLRVEELIAEREAAKQSRDERLSGGRPSFEDDLGDLTDRDGETLPDTEALSLVDEPRPESERGTASAFDVEPTAEGLDPDEVIAMNREEAVTLEPEPEAAPSAEPIVLPAAQDGLWESTSSDDELTESLQRQATALDVPDDLAVEDEVSTATMRMELDEVTAASSGALVASSPSIHPDYADSRTRYDDPADERAEQRPVDPDTPLGSGPRLYSVYRRSARELRAVKQGVSWPALFLTLPWLLSRQLFGTAIIYVLLWAVLVGALLFSGLAWLDAGAAVSTELRLWTAGFGLLALIGLFYLPWRQGNRWVARKLERRGYRFTNTVRAANRDDALSTVRRYANQSA